LDLSLVFSFLPPDAHAIFRKIYGHIDDHTWQRARFHALHYAMALWHYGREVKDEALCQVGKTALEFTLFF
jgi:hypothetical protein